MPTPRPVTTIRKFFIESEDPGRCLEMLTAELPAWAVQSAFRPVDGKFHVRIECVIIGDVWVAAVSTKTGYAIERREAKSRRFNLYFVEQGSCHIVSEDASPLLIEAGQTYLFKPQDTYMVTTAPSTAKTIVIVPFSKYSRLLPARAGDALAHFLTLTPLLPTDHPVARVVHQTARLFQAPAEYHSPFEASSFGTSVFKEAIWQTLMFDWPRNGSGISNPGPMPANVRRALTWIDANLGRKMTLQEIAKAAGTSSRTLQVLFKKTVGVSPIQYVIRTRLRHVHEMLTDFDSDETIAAISSRFGFTHLSDFEKRYRDQYGRTPSESRLRSRLSYPKE